MSRYTRIYIILFFCLLAGFLFARGPGDRQSPTSSKTTPIDGFSTLANIGNISYWVSADGESGRNPYFGEAGVFYPRSTAEVIFATGVVWGARVLDANPDIRVGGQTYVTGTLQGWIETPGTYFGNDSTNARAISPSSSQARIYRVRPDYQGLTTSDPGIILDAAEHLGIDTSQVTTGDAQAILDQYAMDWNNWPADLGAPYVDTNNNGTYDPSTDTPGIPGAHQTIWFACNDLNPARTRSLYGSIPIGLEQQVTLWSFNQTNAFGQTVFRRDRLINKSGYALDSMFVCNWSDPDVGNYTDDVVGVNVQDGFSFGYNGFATDSRYDQYGLPPAAIGFALLQGPIVPSPGDSACFDFHWRQGYRNLPIRSFGYFAAGSSIPDPPLGNPDGTVYFYNLLNGYKPGPTPEPYLHLSGPNAGRPTAFPLDGDPFLQTGDLDAQGNNLPPGDRRLVTTFGGFTMQPGDTQEFVMAITGGIQPSGNHLDAYRELQDEVRQIRNLWNLGTNALPVVTLQTINFPNNTVFEMDLVLDMQSFPGASNVRMDLSPQIGGSPNLAMDFFDDGLHNDGAAGDNIWGGHLSAPNLRYPYNGDLQFTQNSATRNLVSFISDLRLRPSPDLENFRIVWENASQDSSLNPGELVRLSFDVENRDGTNTLETVRLLNIDLQGSNNEVVLSTPVPAGGTVRLPDSDNLVLETPTVGDSTVMRVAIFYDGHQSTLQFPFNITAWTPPTGYGDTLAVVILQGYSTSILPIVADPEQLNGHEYLITFTDNGGSELRWNLFDQTDGVQVIDQAELSTDPYFQHPLVAGIRFEANETPVDFASFQIVANASGPLPTPGSAGFAVRDFPTPNNQNPDPAHQANGGRWAIHTGMTTDNDGTFSYFKTRVTQGGARWPLIVPYDFEIRFTGDSDNFGYQPNAYVTGSSLGGLLMDVPFELWRIGIGTPDDPSDDVRLFPYLIDFDSDGIFALIDEDHSASGLSDDPFTDWFYWVLPNDLSPGESGYQALLNQIQTEGDTYEYNSGTQGDAMRRMVLILWNGGDVNTGPPYVSDMPESGSVFRILTAKPNNAGDSLLVRSELTGIPTTPVPGNFALHQNYPNPFNPTTTLRFDLPQQHRVELSVFNVLGQKVATLLDKNLAAGRHELVWDGQNAGGHPVSSGIYFYRLKAGDFIKTRKMILLR